MKLRVNLYQVVLQPRLEKMPLKQVAWLVGAVLVLLTVGGLWNYQQLLQQRQQADLVGKQVQNKLKELEVYQTSLSGRQPSLMLQQQAQQLQQSIGQKQQLLSYLKQEISKTPPQYSQVLSHLAAIDLPGIWLTSFQLGQQQQFSGVVKDSQLLPQWLQALGKNALLQGQSFDGVKLQPLTQAPYLSFDVSARPALLAEETLLQAPVISPTTAPATTQSTQATPTTPASGGQP
ncbi:hypothetical protein EOE67_18455 [Rheinheimera riviphila]|uniref:MSHA biogenesis protein MshI n=1 Tax=Rheinheimera riviphila TaxID=1834037 RepID=A0A437QES7_9GAMM|nr:hypothetical protein [Rheinheimera riviphila]RVU33057.1 hypothetical protein EOE67_18455 [Rheinheimera riviphila]